jgi:hypothetical protein
VSNAKETLQMHRFIILGLALTAGAPAAIAVPQALPALSSPVLRVGATDCRGPIATEQRPITDAKLLAKMRRDGKLPDKFVCGRCEYDLAGDPGAAYYVKTCH